MNTIYTILAQAGDAASSATTEQAAQGGSFLQSPIVIYGKITNKTDKTFTIKVADSTKIEILKNAVSSKVEGSASGEAPKTEEIQK